MSVNITISSGEDEPFEAQIERLPAQVEVERSNSGMMMFVFGPVALVLAFIFFSITAPALTLPLVLLLALALGFLLFKVWRRRKMRHLIRFDKEGVEVFEVTLWGVKNWSAAYAEYEGVLLRRRVAKSARGDASYQIIELKHADDENKSLPLYAHMTERAPISQWRAYAALFHLPALEEEDD